MTRIAFAILALLAGLLTVPLVAQSAVADTGCPSPSLSYAGGAGTQASPWEISTASELQKLRDDSIAGWDDSFILTANINMSGCTWNKTIGDGSRAFTGMVDGSGFTVSGLTITPTPTDDTVYAGLIGRMSAPGVLTRISFTGAVSGARSSLQSPVVYSGGLVGHAGVGTLISYSRASGNVSASAQGGGFASSAPTGAATAGGLVGVLSGTVLSSYATGSASAGALFVTSPSTRAGGLVGQTPDGTAASITHSYSTGVANAVTLGGFLGSRGSSTTINGSLWDVTSSTRATGVGSGSATGAAGKTTTQMQQFSTYDDSSWPIVNGWQAFDANANKVWGICNGSTRAFLLWQYSTNPCATAPGAPMITGVTPSGTSASLAFTADDSGGAALTRLEFAFDDTTAVDDSTTNLTSPATLSGLSMSTDYVVYMRAVNSQGPGNWSAPVSFRTQGRPGIPVVSGVTPDLTSVSVAFTADDSGGSTILQIQYALDDTNSLYGTSTNVSPVTLAGLTSGTSYRLYVRAVNSLGPSPWSSATAFTTLTPPPPPAPIPPSAPIDVRATAGDASLRASWSAPAAPGDFTVTNYQATASPSGRSCMTTSTACTIDGLTNGTSYTVTVRALSGAGWSVASTPSEAVVPRADESTSLTIAGSRGSGAERSMIRVRGTSTGLAGERVTLWLAMGDRKATPASAMVQIRADGTFTWSRKLTRAVVIYAEAGGVRSNAIRLPAAR